MPGQDRQPVYKFGAWEIDLARREMRLNGIHAEVGSRAFEIIEALVQSAGELVEKYDLMNNVWPGATVEENTLQAQISAIRKALGPDRGLLKTIAGRGYRLLGEWVIEREDFAATGIPTSEPTRSCVTNITAQTGELIGRKSAEAQLLDLLSTYRMVTMTGPGGIGKTVLAQAVARSLHATFGGDGLLVELAPLLDPALVPLAVAAVLDLRQSGDGISFEAIGREIGANSCSCWTIASISLKGLRGWRTRSYDSVQILRFWRPAARYFESMASMSIAFLRLMFQDRAEMENTISSHAAQCSS